MDDYNLLPKLFQNLLEILNDEEYYDVTIEVGNDPYIKIFRAHMVILHYRSTYLRRMLSTNKKNNDGTLVHIKLPNILPEIFQIILRYIYSGRISLEEYDTSDIIKILIAGSELGLQELITYIQSFLIKTKANWMEQNFNLIYQTCFENDSFLELQNFCTNLTSEEPDKIFKSLNFASIPEKLLITIIQSDNLQMEEIQVWNHVLKWGLAQNPELSSDPANFSKEDFNTLKNSLHNCIPFIRFYNLTSDEFSKEILPYKKVLPKELYKDLLKYFLDSNNQSIKQSKPRMAKKNNIDSRIITTQHAELISKWIDRLKITDEIETAYKFQLLFRGSRDGFTAKKFHEICDYQSNTITIVKVKDSTEILGGYNPIEWNSDCCYRATKDSFIFSFRNRDDIESYILSRVKDEQRAIFNSSGFGPSFDYGLILINDSGLCGKNYYENQIRETEDGFYVEEYEHMKNNKLLPQNLLMIEYYDITIEIGNDPYVKFFRAHMVILHYSSTKLQKILTTNKRKNDGTLVHIKLPNISPEVRLAQNPELPSDPANFSKEDFDNLRNNLQNCIPHIRFYNLSSNEFSNEVLPYNKILPEELYEELLEYFLYSNNQSIKQSKPRMATKKNNIVSKIITTQHAELNINPEMDR
ncbi:BTB-domain-containing protein [Rhizophagus irregularis]|uniref:BTB-domain-containing protein n=1 Tax=Rhizophagus irregularis TaxID=588596 RepID=A0A2N1MYK1_9GLOM|nr:BTB-domain-containing protein [Rhizophagus irregularis]